MMISLPISAEHTLMVGGISVVAQLIKLYIYKTRRNMEPRMC